MIKLDKPLPYDAFVEILHALGINPNEFRQYCGENVYGYFPDLNRQPKVNAEELARVMWGK